MTDWRDDLDANEREALRRTGMPGWTQPMRATLTDKRFSSPDWIFERKLDGERRLDPQRWHLKNVLRRLGQKTDPWADIRRHATAVGRAHRALRDLPDS